VTDDAEGDVLTTTPADGVIDADIARGVALLTGDIEQVPSAVSAKVDGQRAYKLVRAGEGVDLPARPVTVRELVVLATRRAAGVVDVDVRVVCSSGTYVRALARDLGDGLGVGGHLTALRRTRVGPYALAVAHTLDRLAEDMVLLPISDAARAAFPARDVDADEAKVMSHGGPLPSLGVTGGPVAVFGPDGGLLALVEERGATTKALAVFVSAAGLRD